MTSDRKVAANRRNAQKSAGPRTLSGKAIASMNALKHGLCSRKPLIPGENEADFNRFSEGWVDELRPAGPHQHLAGRANHHGRLAASTGSASRSRAAVLST